MLSIRPEQKRTLTEALHSRFIKRLVQMLKAEHPDSKDVPPHELEKNIHQLLEKAESYGLTTEQQVGVYVMVAWEMGMDFDTRHAAVSEVLSAGHFTAGQKSEWLVEWSDRMLAALAAR